MFPARPKMTSREKMWMLNLDFSLSVWGLDLQSYVMPPFLSALFATAHVTTWLRSEVRDSQLKLFHAFLCSDINNEVGVRLRVPLITSGFNELDHATFITSVEVQLQNCTTTL